MKTISGSFSALAAAVLVSVAATGCATQPTATTAPLAPTQAAAPQATTIPASPTPTQSDVTADAATAAPAAATATTASDLTKDDAYATALTFNNAAWRYDADHDVYWQIGVAYAAKPQASDYESLGIYVPGAYVNATANGDGTYTTKVNAQGAVNGFSAQTAPLVFPVNTPGYAAAKAPTEYSYEQISSYLQAGFIYVEPGLRGRDNGYDPSGALVFSGGAPWGVTDLKAAIRYVRYNKAVLPGNTDSIFVFGMSGGGAQTSVAAASGDSPLYTPYLEAIGAAMYDADGQPISDAVLGAMAWCPITSLDYADAAYEWNLGQYATSATRADGTFTAALSKDLARSYADYINKLGLKDGDGNVLVLQESSEGIYAAGSYYDYLIKTVETSLNNFLIDTTFPYTKTSGGMRRFPGGPPPGGQMPAGGAVPSGTVQGGGMPMSVMTPTVATTTTYQTAQEYIAALNADTPWIAYDAASNTAKVTSLAGFVNSQKTPSKSVGAFDSLERTAGENNVFGNDAQDSLHFDPLLANLLTSNEAAYAKYANWKATYVSDFASDLKATDRLGNGILVRMNMYNPMYFLMPYYEGYQTAKPATYWRINSGIQQGDTATTVEMNLALALANYSDVKIVDFTTVWGQAHVEAERTGDSTTNFIAWVVSVIQK